MDSHSLPHRYILRRRRTAHSLSGSFVADHVSGFFNGRSFNRSEYPRCHPNHLSRTGRMAPPQSRFPNLGIAPATFIFGVWGVRTTCSRKSDSFGRPGMRTPWSRLSPLLPYSASSDHRLHPRIQRELDGKHKDTPEASASEAPTWEPTKEHRQEELPPTRTDKEERPEGSTLWCEGAPPLPLLRSLQWR